MLQGAYRSAAERQSRKRRAEDPTTNDTNFHEWEN
jgi:hypothetical protein